MGESDERFRELGDHLVEMLRLHAGLKPDSRVLDIGSGYGRLPHALMRGGFEGEYLGLDVQRRQIRWCARNLGSERFAFRHVDLHNERYHPAGKGSIRDLDLEQGSYDVVCAFSVFTHMWPEDVEAYLDVFRRALATDGKALATFFLIDEKWRRLEAEGKVALRLPNFRGAHCRYESEEEPLHIVGYDIEWVLRAGFVSGLLPAGPPVFGLWSWRPVESTGCVAYQDTVAFQRI